MPVVGKHHLQAGKRRFASLGAEHRPNAHRHRQEVSESNPQEGRPVEPATLRH